MKNFLKVLTLILTLVILGSCATRGASEQGCVTCEEPVRNPLKSFVILRGVLNEVVIMEGSGAIVATDEHGAYILTADHICDLGTPAWRVQNAVPSRISVYLKAVNLRGSESQIQLLARDSHNDLCLGYAPGMTGEALLVSDQAVTLGGKFHTLSNPRGWAGPGRVLMYEGYYSGLLTKDGVTLGVYSLTATYGSSGSPILDSKNKIVGVISRIATNAPSITMSPVQGEVKTFVLNNLCEHAKQTCDRVE